jgi:hypothetical protein
MHSPLENVFRQFEDKMGLSFPGFVEDEFNLFLISGIVAHRCRHWRCADDNPEGLVALTDHYRYSSTSHRDVIA